MSLDHVCSKKDKRLLVLLALSLLVMISNVTFPENYTSTAQHYSWLQISGDENVTYRYNLTEIPINFTESGLLGNNEDVSVQINMLKQERAVAAQIKLDRSTTFTSSVSPRLAFFLGQPFSINTASNKDLSLIPGIGSVLAANIIAYRDRKAFQHLPGVAWAMQVPSSLAKPIQPKQK